jgi:hypothetical protein
LRRLIWRLIGPAVRALALFDAGRIAAARRRRERTEKGWRTPE